ncbi:MAG TPA: hypothetical protein VGL02_04145, partial [Streptomyces sp.]
MRALRNPRGLGAGPGVPGAMRELCGRGEFCGRRERRRRLVRRAVRWGGVCVALAAGALWWLAVLRLVARPDGTGAWEGAVAAGGWGLGLIPLHAVPKGGLARGRP